MGGQGVADPPHPHRPPPQKNPQSVEYRSMRRTEKKSPTPDPCLHVAYRQGTIKEIIGSLPALQRKGTFLETII
jgi:hypothetical protein